MFVDLSMLCVYPLSQSSTMLQSEVHVVATHAKDSIIQTNTASFTTLPFSLTMDHYSTASQHIVIHNSAFQSHCGSLYNSFPVPMVSFTLQSVQSFSPFSVSHACLTSQPVHTGSITHQASVKPRTPIGFTACHCKCTRKIKIKTLQS